MNQLPFNIDKLNDLKWPYLISFLTLPWLGIPIFIGAFRGILNNLGLPMSAIYHPITLIEIPLFALKVLAMGAVFIIIGAQGFFTGWLLNTLFSFLLMGCNYQKWLKIFWQSELPTHWYKSSISSQLTQAQSSFLKSWGQRRKKGRSRFIISITLLWTVLIVLSLGAIFRIDLNSTDPQGLILCFLVTFSIYGIFFSSYLWFSAERKYKKLIKKREYHSTLPDSLNS